MKNYYYERQIELKGNFVKVIEMLLNTFIQNNFRIIKKGSSSFELEGPGMNSSRQNPIVGISHVKVMLNDNLISVRAVMGGVAKMKRFMMMLISGMAVFFVLLFGTIFFTVDVFQDVYNEISPLYIIMWSSPLFIWIALIPVLTRLMKSRTTRALDIAVENVIKIFDE